MKKKSENSIKKEKNNLPKRSRVNKAVTVRIPLDKHVALQKKANDIGVSINELLNLYIEGSEEQKSSTHETTATIEDDSFTELEAIQEDAILSQSHSTNNFGIRYEKVGIGSSTLTDIYFKGFKWALVENIIIVPLVLGGYLLSALRRPYWETVIGVLAFPALGVLWASGRIIFGSIRKDGYRVISGWGWLAGLLSLIVSLATIWFGFTNLDHSTIMGLLILLAGTIFVGLLVNAPAEISIELNKRRVRQINEHISEWDEEVCQTIINREIQPDMTKEMVLLSWGEPIAIENQEAIRGYFTEKWAYKSSNKSMYVWFTNGIVDKINNSGI